MARTIDSAKRVINGTYGEVWVDGEKKRLFTCAVSL